MAKLLKIYNMSKLKFFIPLILISNLAFALEAKVTKLNNQKPERLLYIGNSYLYYNDSLHNHVRRMLEEYYQKEIERSNYKSVTISGSRLSHHNIDYSLDYKKLGAEKPFESKKNICFSEILKSKLTTNIFPGLLMLNHYLDLLF